MRTRTTERQKPRRHRDSLEDARGAAYNILAAAQVIADAAPVLARIEATGDAGQIAQAYRTLIRIWGIAVPPDI